MRILDLGCGKGTPSLPIGKITGVDINLASLRVAAMKYPQRHFLYSPAELLPFADQSFDRIVCNVALPYMQIPRALREARRVLKPAGELHVSVHPFRFTWGELGQCQKLKPALYRLFVILNGLVFHFTGWSRWESFQTERGMRIALLRAGFERVECGRADSRMIFSAQ